MKDSPFIYGSPVKSNSFTNRENEAKKLFHNLTGGINTMIVSPRRWGKSSLVEKVIDDVNIKRKNLKTIIIDLFSVSGEEEFLEVFARKTIQASSSRYEDWIKTVKDFFKQLVPKITVGIDPINDFSLSFNWEALREHKDEILNLPEAIASKKNINFIICLDEFQNLASFHGFEALEKKMRAAWQRHNNVTYCLYGSKRHMMNDIFNNPSKPFYRFGDLMELQKINTESWVSFIIKGFSNTGKSINESDAKLIPGMMKDHSWYVQQLSHYTWQKTDKKAGRKEITSALDELIYANTPLYQKEVENISSTQLNLLKAIVKGETQLTSGAVMNKYKLGTPRNVIRNKKNLSNKDIIYELNKKYELLDPAFEMWFLKQFFNEDYKLS